MVFFRKQREKRVAHKKKALEASGYSYAAGELLYGARNRKLGKAMMLLEGKLETSRSFGTGTEFEMGILTAISDFKKLLEDTPK